MFLKLISEKSKNPIILGNNMELKTERLTLREFDKNDLKNLVVLANNLNVSKYLEKVPYPYTESDGKWFINKSLTDSREKPRQNYELVIEYENNLVGIIGLTSIDDFNESATLGYWLGEDYWKKGIMFEAAKEIIRFALEDLNLRRIDVEADTNNEASNNLIKKLGFEYEGLRKQYTKIKATGKIGDTNIYGLLK